MKLDAISKVVVGSTVALASTSYGNETMHVVDTVHGLAIENQFIASVTDGKCDYVRGELEAFKSNARDQRRRLDDKSSVEDEAMSSIAAIEEDCFVMFSGDHETANFVQQLDFVTSVEQDLVMHSEVKPASWGLDRIDQEKKALDAAPFSASHTGKGVHVYIIDTGINRDHSEFALEQEKSRAEFGHSFVNEGFEEDGNGHGTHCAGTAVGATFGVAREANVVGVKVLSSRGSGATSGVINGISWAVSHAKAHATKKTAVLSLSLGGGWSNSMNKAVEDASNAGMIVVVAAGNDNSDACNFSPAAAGGNAKRGGVISVGSTTSSDTRSSFSNYGACVDIFAPGTSITSAWMGGQNAIETISGTSMAAPHVAGVAAILLEKHNFDKEAAQAELLAIALPDALSNVKEGSPNLLLQVPTYTGPPTPPTQSPTPPPTRPDPTVCMGNACAEFKLSSFGPELSSTKAIQAPLFVTGDDEYLCDKPSSFKLSDLEGKVVLVPRGPSGGSCLFYDKVKTAESAGALAVLIHLTKAEEKIFAPNYYGDDQVQIPSMMIDYADAKAFAKKEGESIFIGSQPLQLPQNPTQTPTQTPTQRPSQTPTQRPSQTPTKSPSGLDACHTLKPFMCRKRVDCFTYKRKGSKKTLCEQVTAAPTVSPDVWTPNRCPRGSITKAQTTCAQLGMRLCSSQELRYGVEANPDVKCSSERKNVWTTDTSCDATQELPIYNSFTDKSGCKSSKNTKSYIRCCEAA